MSLLRGHVSDMKYSKCALADEWMIATVRKRPVCFKWGPQVQ